MLCCKFEYNTHYTLCTWKSCKTWLIYVKKIFTNNVKQILHLFINDVLQNVMHNNSDKLCQFTIYNFEWRSSLMKTYKKIDFSQKKIYIFIMNTVCVIQKNKCTCWYIKKNISFYSHWKSECVHNKHHVLQLACEIRAKWCHFKTIVDACLKNKLTGLQIWNKWRLRA